MSQVEGTPAMSTYDIVLGTRGCFGSDNGLYRNTIRHWVPNYKRAQLHRKRLIVDICYRDLINKGIRFYCLPQNDQVTTGTSTLGPVADEVEVKKRVQRHLADAVREEANEGAFHDTGHRPISSDVYYRHTKVSVAGFGNGAKYHGPLLLPRPSAEDERKCPPLLPLRVPPRHALSTTTTTTTTTTPAATAATAAPSPSSLTPPTLEAASSLHSLSESAVLDCFLESGWPGVDKDGTVAGGDAPMNRDWSGVEVVATTALSPTLPAALHLPPAPPLDAAVPVPLPLLPIPPTHTWPDIYVPRPSSFTHHSDGADAISQLTDDNLHPNYSPHRREGNLVDKGRDNWDERFGRSILPSVTGTVSPEGDCRPDGWWVAETTVVTEDGSGGKERTFVARSTISDNHSSPRNGWPHRHSSSPRSPRRHQFPNRRRRRRDDDDKEASEDYDDVDEDSYACDSQHDDDDDDEKLYVRRRDDDCGGVSRKVRRRLERMERRWVAGERERRRLRRRVLALEERLHRDRRDWGGGDDISSSAGSSVSAVPV